MEQGDGFWTPSKTKGWKTRREQQDAYRKALDQQIEQRKQMDKERFEKFKASSTSPPVQITDPVRHLMPWIDNSAQTSSPSTAPTKNVPTTLPVAVPPPPAYLHQQPIPQYQFQPVFGSPAAAPPSQMYYMPAPQPHQNPQHYQTDSNNNSVASTHSHSSTSLTSHQQPQQSTNVAYGYYPSPAVPPPPPATFTPPYARYSDYPDEVDDNQNPIVTPSGGEAAPQNFQHPTSDHSGPSNPTTVYLPPLASSPEQNERDSYNHQYQSHPKEQFTHLPQLDESQYQSYQSSEADYSPDNRNQQEIEKMINLKPHVSQSCLDIPDLSKFKDHYRNDLQKQVEERKRVEEERRTKEKQEEERLHRKVQDDQERMRLEYESEAKRRALKEEQVQMESEMAKQRLEEQCQKDSEMRRQEQAARRRQLLEESQKNARTCQKSSPDRYFHRDEETVRENPWDSKPIPTVEKMAYERGGGDGMGAKASTRKNQESEAVLPLFNPGLATYRIHDDRNYEYDQRLESGERQNPLTSKSSEVVSSRQQKYEWDADDGADMIMCPKCSKSFSSTDIRVPKTEEDRRNFLNFLENISKQLNEEQDQISKGAFDWKR